MALEGHSQRASAASPRQDNDRVHCKRWLKFSIENILRPDFGQSQKRSNNIRSDEKKKEADDALGPVDQSPAHELQGGDQVKDSECNDSVSNPDIVWPAWVYCTRYSDRPSSGPRSRRIKKKGKKQEEKRPRTAFANEQLARLKKEFQENRYLTENRRQDLARELKLNESQIKIWFQNKRAKIKKANGQRNILALQLRAQGLYNHTTTSNCE